ncbi:MAG: type II secretion system inner membrane protein GspF [Desulfobacteraceae bacterium]|jgi:general secretion pathway protein F
MPVYEYTALDKGGKSLNGIIDADSALSARQKLRGTGIYPVEIKETSARPREKPSRSASLSTLLKRVRSGELSATTRQLSILLGAGVPLVSALEALITQLENPNFKRILAQVKESVNEGNSLAFSLSQHPRIFSQVYINMVRAGEASGSLDVVLDRLAEFSERQQALRGRFRAALAYPIFMACVGTLILFFLVTFVMPNITRIFVEMEQTLPLATIFLIGMSHFLKSYWWVVLLVLAGIALLGKQFTKTAKGQHLWDEVKLRVPILGTISRKMALARFGRTLGSLLQSGVPLLTALEIVRNIVNNVLIAEVIDRAMDEIQEGKTLAVPLSRSRWFPSMMIQMISVGEQSGELERMLHKIADIYEGETESRIMAVTAMLEPAMILAMGLAVGFIVISILLPIFEMNQLVR